MKEINNEIADAVGELTNMIDDQRNPGNLLMPLSWI